MLNFTTIQTLVVISKKAKYAINALMVLAAESGKEEAQPLFISQVAEKGRIPKKFLELILLDMKSAGYVISRRGKAGGYTLRGEPQEINLADVIRMFDGPIALLPCVTHRYYEPCEECVDERTCALRHTFQRVREATVEILKNTTLADMLRKETDLQHLLLNNMLIEEQPD